MTRSHRRGIERLIFAQAFRCSSCNARQRRTYFDASFDEFANCPRCGNSAPDRRSRRDKVDSMLHSPIRMIHWALGGTLYHCVFCRLQFYDVRGLKPLRKATEPDSASKAKMAS
jgi:uncharacterized paraquat-inducible protein A